MLRITPWRILRASLLLSFVLAIVLPTLWLALPSPPISIEERATYIQSTLTAGKPVIAAWDPKPLKRTDLYVLESDWCSECTSVLFHWQFVSLHDKVNILLAPHEQSRDYWARGRSFELEHQFFRATAWNDRAAGGNDTWSPFFVDSWGPPTWSVMVSAGREDERISQGWFHEVDRHLIQHELMKWKTEVDLRPVIPEPGVVEFWRGAAVDRAFDDTSDGQADSLNKSDVLMAHSRTPGIYAQMRESEKDIDLVAAFQVPRNPGVRDIVVRRLKGDLPSHTWPVRHKLIEYLSLFIIEPVVLFKAADDLLAPYLAGFLVTLFILLTLYIGRICCSWVAAGCPNFSTWSSTFWLTRYLVPRRWGTTHRRQHIWSSSGPMDLNSAELTRQKDHASP